MPAPRKIDHDALVGCLKAGMTQKEIGAALGVSQRAVSGAMNRMPRRRMLEVIRSMRPPRPIEVRKVARVSDIPATMQTIADELTETMGYLFDDQRREEAMWAEINAKRRELRASASAAAPGAGQAAAPDRDIELKEVSKKVEAEHPRMASAARVAAIAHIQDKRIKAVATLLQANEHYLRLAGLERFIAEFHAILSSRPEFGDLRRAFVNEMLRKGFFHFVTDQDRVADGADTTAPALAAAPEGGMTQ